MTATLCSAAAKRPPTLIVLRPAARTRRLAGGVLGGALESDEAVREAAYAR
ncbi:MAG: hypothetical protein QOK30_2815 [Nocardioidaceae bacterium]|nr:hypothetical protein [Nocardioidaceae bacterium]